MDYVEWENISTGVYIAKSSSVLSVEECPLCKKAMSTEANDFGEVHCFGSHVFAADDDGDLYTLAHLDSLPAKVGTKYVTETDSDGNRIWIANLANEVVGCPMCQAPLDLSGMADKRVDGCFYTCCSNGHEFETYVRVPHIWFYEPEDGPFATWVKDEDGQNSYSD